MKKKICLAILTATILMISTVAVFAKGREDKGRDRHDKDVVGAVYVMTNAASGNEVVIFNRDEKGLLTKAGSISTEGDGSGGLLDPLGSQESLVLSENKRWLFAVNAGSDEISVFRVRRKGLKLVDQVWSGGEFPVSLTVFHDLVYVLNAGTPDAGTLDDPTPPNITGFRLSHKGELSPLDDSTRWLGSGAFAQVGFDPEGDVLVVTDRGEHEILVYSVDRKGLPDDDPVTSPSNGAGPFGFIFDERGHLLVSEAGRGAASSYKILHDGKLEVISPSVENDQIATCWIAGNERGNVFTANTGSQTISAYKLKGRSGKLALLDETAGFGNRPIDMAITVNGRFLYALDPADGAIDMFQIERDGSLTDLGTVEGGLSIFAQGIAAR